ncbi:YiaA/YiaB family inner membrane protein [Pseudosulfitobacter sp. SM2401]|uniref:YiaA/YiaB family inner membrane protein n=1 Tax=Pseudosulfitobacter sp. SM2401 TaxID=3350098 RepID=UPI002A34C837|nr:YiaA/YiaB family inner membrane protein [Ascidiaceihabitans sp.]
MNNENTDNGMILFINVAGVLIAYVLLAISLWLSTEVPLSTKGYWGMGIVLLTISLINVVKYRFDWKLSGDRIQRIEDAKNEKILEDFVSDPKA